MMPDYDNVLIEEGEVLTAAKWNKLVGYLEDIDLKIPTNENGEILNAVTIGTKPGDGTELNYPWEYESIGVAKKGHNLRLQSPNSIFFFTDIGAEEQKNKEKARLEITKNGHLRISTNSGWVDVGSKHPEWAHFYTDRTKYYFDKEIRVDTGKIGSHNENLQLCIGGQSKLSILKSNGNVGIGTTAPKQKLSVVGDINFNNHALIANAASAQHGGANNIDHLWHDDTTNSWHFVSDKPYKNEGNSKLSAGNIYLNDTSKNSYFAGNIGVGTKSPKHKLDVKGTIRCTAVESHASDRGGILKGKHGNNISFGWSGNGRGGYWLKIYVNDVFIKAIDAWGVIKEGHYKNLTGTNKG